MKKIKILLSLTTNDNDYQIEQAASAEETARKLGVDLQIVYADNDAINQSQQLLKIIQSGAEGRPDAIVFEPAGSTGLPQVAKAAVSAGIGWVILNREVDYVAQLRAGHKVPVFCITSDHKEIGRIQGHQISNRGPRAAWGLHPLYTRTFRKRRGTTAHGRYAAKKAGKRSGSHGSRAVDGGEFLPGCKCMASALDFA